VNRGELAVAVLGVELGDGKQLARELRVQLRVISDHVVEIAEHPRQKQ
jgi:hypothetical protein